MRIRHLLIALLIIAPQVHAELWRDISDQSIKDKGSKLIISDIIKRQEDGQLVVTYKDYIDDDFYGLDKLLINCSDKTVRNLGGRFYARDYHPTNVGTPINSNYVSKDRAPKYQLLYEEVCRE